MEVTRAQSEGLEPVSEWYVIYTKPNAEEVAGEHLERKDLPVFSPKIKEYYYSGKEEKVRIMPLFPNYLFVRIVFPEDYYKVMWAKGVRRIVGNGGKPIPLDISIVEFFQKQCGEDGIMHPPSRFNHLDKVRVKIGPMEGMTGIIDSSLDSRGRVKVLMKFLKEGVRAEMQHSLLERC